MASRPRQVVAADEKVASEAAAEADGIKKETPCLALRRGCHGESRILTERNPTKKPYDWGNQDPLAMGYSPFLDADVGITGGFCWPGFPIQ